jgi:hypothetical protein
VNTKTTSNIDDDGFGYTFDVVVERVVGTISVEHGRGLSPRQAAWELICNEGDEGKYSFPLEEGKTEHIWVHRTEA